MGSKSLEQCWVCEALGLPQGLLGDTDVPSENDRVTGHLLSD